MNPNPADMLVFVTVAEQKSFTAAANILGKTTSAVSQTIARLEQALDTQLFYRTTRSISLTEEGQRALTLFTDMRDAYDAATTEMASSKSNPEGTFSVTAPHALSESIMVPALSEYSAQFPGVNIRLISEDHPLNIIERRIDLSVRVGNPTAQNARISKVGMLEEQLYASPEYIVSKGGMPSSIAILWDWDHVANEWQGSPIKITAETGEKIRVTPKFQCTSTSDVLRFSMGGLGVALLPETVAKQAVQEGKLEALFPISITPIYAVHHYEKGLPAKVSEFIQILRQKLSE